MNSLHFNPFTIGPDHNAHSTSTQIIKLEESNQVFCPLCLSSDIKQIERIRDDLFERYVRGLFEALDQHGEKKYVRDIVLSILEIILSRRDICIRSDHDFHNLLRIIHKILNSEKFRLNEFPAVTQMFSAITRKFTSDDPIPLVSVSKATQVIIDCAGKQLGKCLDDSSATLRSDVMKLLRSVYITIRAYLELLGRFAIYRSSDLIFPLCETDDPQMHSRDYHRNNQIQCLEFAYIRLFPPTINHLKSVDRLDKHETSLVLGLFQTLRECFLSAVRVEHSGFIQYVIKEDCLLLAHTHSYKCTDVELRTAIKSFLKAFVVHYIETKFETDDAFRAFIAKPDIVETNHKNAIAYSGDSLKSDRTIFYIMVNYVANEHKSEYYNQDRLRKVISDVDPSLFYSSKSSVVIKVYLQTASLVLRKVSALASIEKFFRRLWTEIKDGTIDNNIEEEFCSSEKTFLWVYQHPTFKRLITWRSIKRLVEIGFSQISITHNLLRLLNDDFYKGHVIGYLENDESSVKLIGRFTATIEGCNFHVGDRYHKPLMTKLGAVIPAILYGAIEKLLKNLDDSATLVKTERLTNMIFLWINHCRQLDLLLDHDFITTWFKLMDRISIRQTRGDKKFEELIIIFIELICTLMEINHSQSLKILGCLNYTCLGLMYTWLTGYTMGDKLGEKVAHLIMTYDELDYPLEHDAVEGLLEMNPNILNWMLSNNRDLHALSIRCARKTFKNQKSRTTRAVVATGLINMVAQNPDILRIKELAEAMKALATEEEILYHPMLSRVRCNIPDDLVAGLEEHLETQVSPSPSPPLSFVSDESDIFEEENISVMRILTQLQNEETPEIDNSCSIPESLFISKSLVDRHVNSVDTGDWERLASESCKNREASV